MRSIYNLADQQISAQLIRRAGKPFLIIDQKETAISVQDLGDDEYRVSIEGHASTLVAIRQGEQFFIHFNGRNFQIDCEDENQTAIHGTSDEDKTIAYAPMPGTVVSVNVEPGQSVEKGDTLLVIESMKMETTIATWRDGVVKNIYFNVTDSFDRQAALVELEAGERE